MTLRGFLRTLESRLKNTLPQRLRICLSRWRYLLTHPALPVRLLLALDHLSLQRARREPARRAAISPLDWGRGISIVIPERGGGDMLARCLASLATARSRLDEPSEVIVVVNGSPRADYATLAMLHPDLQWQFHAQPLGFTRAVLQGLATVQYGGVYLLNNDMVLAPEALSALLPVRAPHVFGIASQIAFEAGRRREETGWTKMHVEDGLANPYHEAPEGELLRGTVWAGAGSALFQRGLLVQLLPGCLVFDPFYWEDVDLGLRAWRQGYDSLLCPASHVVHGHRVTVKRYYGAAEVERVFERNRVQLRLRHPLPQDYKLALLARLYALDTHSLHELTRPRALLALWQARREAIRAPCHDLDYATMAAQLARPVTKRPCIVMVSPFVLLPPHHGGAVRSLQFAQALSVSYDVILLGDERESYSDTTPSHIAPFAAVHLVSGREEMPATPGQDRVARMHNHAHRLLRSELRRLIETRRPAAVLVEHMELAPLIGVPAAHRPAWLLSLHDVLLQPDDPLQRAADAQERDWMRRYDGLVVCSAEDQALVPDFASCRIDNGVDPTVTAAWFPSAGLRNILFIGPFRAQINFDGIVDFLQQVYPQLLSELADVSLTIVGGSGLHARVAGHACFAHPSITLLEHVEDMPALIRAHAVTINPQATLRGSSLKVIESLAAGRVCVSTRAGARGHLHAGFAGLLVVDDGREFVQVLARVLGDEAFRLQIEVPQHDRLAPFSWTAQGVRLLEYVKLCILRVL